MGSRAGGALLETVFVVGVLVLFDLKLDWETLVLGVGGVDSENPKADRAWGIADGGVSFFTRGRV